MATMLDRLVVDVELRPWVRWLIRNPGSLWSLPRLLVARTVLRHLPGSWLVCTRVYDARSH